MKSVIFLSFHLSKTPNTVCWESLYCVTSHIVPQTTTSLSFHVCLLDTKVTSEAFTNALEVISLWSPKTIFPWQMLYSHSTQNSWWILLQYYHTFSSNKCPNSQCNIWPPSRVKAMTDMSLPACRPYRLTTDRLYGTSGRRPETHTLLLVKYI